MIDNSTSSPHRELLPVPQEPVERASSAFWVTFAAAALVVLVAGPTFIAMGGLSHVGTADGGGQPVAMAPAQTQGASPLQAGKPDVNQPDPQQPAAPITQQNGQATTTGTAPKQ